MPRSRSQANTLAVPERQQLETLRREKKTLTDALASVQDKIQQAETKRAKLQGEIDQLADRDEEVSCLALPCIFRMSRADSLQNNERVERLSSDRETVKNELERNQEERVRISKQETEINERLQDTLNKLLQAGVDKQESQREARLKETLATLKRVFPGEPASATRRHGVLLTLSRSARPSHRPLQTDRQQVRYGRHDGPRSAYRGGHCRRGESGH